MVDGTVRAPQKGLIGRVAGAVTERVVDVVDPDIVLDAVDVNSLIEKVDLQRVLERVDLNQVLSTVDVDALLSRVDVNALLSRVDVDELLGRVDVDGLVGRVDVERLLRDVDIEALVRRSGIPEVVAESTSHLAGSTLDVARRQVAGLDFWVDRLVGTVLRRDPDSVPETPPELAAEALETKEGGRRVVTGHYAGPVGRSLAFAADAGIATLLYTAAGATVGWLVRTFIDQGASLEPWLSAVLLGSWYFTYFFVSLVVAGRTPGMALVGLRVVTREGSTLRPWSALVRTVCMPFSFLLFGLGLVGVVIGREHRALHDVAAHSAVVLDFGDRPAELPGPLSRFLDRQEL
ncbi:RDD family protein [uncultured Nocardioides sp.]|uniref:RDD family protein n=1 Tax=uncultured Nocardioides sp. TaxID=198441 RepID=UPI002623E96B|nr:RDD family protein [uncultured Nocardioides sp.]HRD63089.1 RDD family protein [Nocardioides sp.]